MEQVAKQEPISDLGTSACFAKEMSFVKGLFKGKTYVAGGYHPDKTVAGACDIDCDVQNLHEIKTESVGSMISLEVLEHVQDPKKMYRRAISCSQNGRCVRAQRTVHEGTLSECSRTSRLKNSSNAFHLSKKELLGGEFWSDGYYFQL